MTFQNLTSLEEFSHSLHEWFVEHFIEPTISYTKRDAMAATYGMSCPELSSWFANIARRHWVLTIAHMLGSKAMVGVDGRNMDAADAVGDGLQVLPCRRAPHITSLNCEKTVHTLLVNYFCGRPLSTALDDKCSRIRTVAQLAQVAGTEEREIRKEIYSGMRLVLCFVGVLF